MNTVFFFFLLISASPQHQARVNECRNGTGDEELQQNISELRSDETNFCLHKELYSHSGIIIKKLAAVPWFSRRNDAAPESSPQLGNSYDIAGDYFQGCIISLRLLHSWYGSKVS